MLVFYTTVLVSQVFSNRFPEKTGHSVKALLDKSRVGE